MATIHVRRIQLTKMHIRKITSSERIKGVNAAGAYG